MPRPHGFKSDLPHLLNRRTVLGSLAALGAGSASAQSLGCVVASSETQGPFPADGSNRIGLRQVNVLTQSGVTRDDMRTSFAGLEPVAPGAELRLEMVMSAAASGCTPLPGSAIYLWQCDAAGRYSIYEDEDRNYLRAVAIADANGVARITTIVPGCYRGRWPHIHFEVFESADAAVAGRAALITSQLSFEAADCADLYARNAAYAASRRPFDRLTFAGDRLFANNSDAQKAQQMVQMQGAPDAGYTAQVTIGVPV